jgi:hypothetical protein
MACWWLLDRLSNGAQAWIRWARAKALEVQGIGCDESAEAPGAPGRPALAPAPRREPEPLEEPELVGVVLDPAAARKAARDAALRASPEYAYWQPARGA